MVKVGFGRVVGRLGLLCMALLAGCNQDDASGSETSQASTGGRAPGFSALESDVGRVLIVGDSQAAGHFEREFRGLDKPSPATKDYVHCERRTAGPGSIVHFDVGAATTMVAADLELSSSGPQEAVLGPQGETHVSVRLSEDSFGYFEYELSPQAPTSLCQVKLKSFDNERITGNVACQGLVPTAQSHDAAAADPSVGGAGAAASSASATLDFDCPFHVLSSPGEGGSGSGGNAGSGGTFSSAGTAGSSGSGGSTGGSGGGELHCTGVNIPCSLRDSLTCRDGTGCTLDEHCGGVPPSCYGQFSVYSCTAIAGCFWSSVGKNCSGSADLCSSFFGRASCTGQQGCSWKSDCTGTAPLCSELPEALCGLEPSCSLQ